MKANVNDLIISTKEHLFTIYPDVLNVDISIERLEGKSFECKILLSTIHQRFYAKIRRRGYKSSLSHTVVAIRNQLQKIKRNRIHGLHKGPVFLSSVQEPIVENII